MVSDVGPGLYYLQTIPSTTSSCDHNWAYRLIGGRFQFLSGVCCELSTVYSCWIASSCFCAFFSSSGVKPAYTVVMAA